MLNCLFLPLRQVPRPVPKVLLEAKRRATMQASGKKKPWDKGHRDKGHRDKGHRANRK
jgi:hypothetical protein